MEKIGVILEKSIPELKSFGGASVGELVLIVVEVSLRFVLYVALFDEKLSSGGDLYYFRLARILIKFRSILIWLLGLIRGWKEYRLGWGYNLLFHRFRSLIFTSKLF